MSRPRIVNPPALGHPRGYANGVLAPAGSRMLFVAGQVGWDGEQRLVGPGFVEQFERALANVLAVVTEAGGEPGHVVRLTIFVTSRAEYLDSLSALGAAWRRTMGRHYPAMALVEIAGLVEEGAKVEIEATAALPPEEEA